VTPTELRIMSRLMLRPATADELLALLDDELASRHNVHVHLSNLRRKGVRVRRVLTYSIDSTAEVDSTETTG